MKISLNWLQDFIELKETNIDAIKELITAQTAEIETIEDQKKPLENVVIGQITSIEPHPDADRLKVTTVSDGSESFQVVCGGSNLKQGMKIAFAKLGAVVKWHGTETATMKKAKIRGIESSGMICASEEIGIEDLFPKKSEKEITDLSCLSHPIGTPLSEALQLDDIIIDIDNHAITNRADLFSQKGFAREFVVHQLAEWKNKSNTSSPISIPNDDLPIQVEFENANLCKAYHAICIQNIEVKESPDWIKKRLLACGIRPISNLVDITNYVMLELGMPLHAFDLDQVKGKNWKMRMSKKGEKLTTLDEKEFELPNDYVVFDDGNELFDLCGVMGGLNSGINQETKNILLHAPVYDPILVRKAMRGLGQITDAGIVYEKGVDSELAIEGLNRAIELIMELNPNAKISSRIFSYHSEKYEENEILFNPQLIDRLLGIHIPEDKSISILEDLGFKVSKTEEKWVIKIPSWRRNDCQQNADIVEEIGRVYGYDKIEPKKPLIGLKSKPKNPKRQLEKQIKNQLVSLGLSEVYHFSFYGEELCKKAGIKVKESAIQVANPISSDLAIMRTSLLPYLLETITKNSRFQNQFKLFELSKAYEIQEGKPVEKSALILGGYDVNFKEIQGVIEALELTTQPNKEIAETHHPGRSAQLIKRGQVVGYLYELHPLIAKNFDLKKSVHIAEIDLEKIHNMNLNFKKSFQEIPKFPSINLDISLLIPKKDLAESYYKAIQKTDKKLIKSVNLIDEYTGEKIDSTKRSLTFSIEYRSDEKTLTDNEVQAVHKQVITNLSKNGGIIRD